MLTLPWSKHIERKQKSPTDSEYRHFRSSPSVAPFLKRKVVDCQQKRDSKCDRSMSSPAGKYVPVTYTPSSEHTVGVGKHTRKSQAIHSRSSLVGGTSRYATPFSADRKGGDLGGKHKRHYDQFQRLPYTKGSCRFTTPSLEHKGRQKQYLSTRQIPHYSTSYADHRVDDVKHKTEGHCDQSNTSPSTERFSRYATPSSEFECQVGSFRAKQKLQSKSPSRSSRLPSSGVKSSHGAIGQSTSKVTGTQTGQTMQFKRKRQ